MKKPMIIQSVLCSLFGIGLLFRIVSKDFSETAEVGSSGLLGAFDNFVVAILLILVIALLMGVYVLFVLHRRVNKYTEDFKEQPASIEHSLIEEELVEEEIIEEIVEEEVEEVHQHTLVKHEAKAATCIEDGNIEYYECSECGLKFIDESAQQQVEEIVVVALGHDEIHHEAKAATCNEAGHNEYVTCSRCEHSTYEEIPALGHDEVHHEAKAATCDEAGHNEYVTCSRCEHSTYEEIPALGHDEVHHEAKAATCDETGHNEYVTCSRCEYSTYEEVPATGHKLVEHEAVEPTYEVEGKVHYFECEECHKYFEDEECTHELDLSQLSIPVLEAPVEEVVEETPIEEAPVVESALATHEMQDLIKESVTVEEAKEALEDSQLKELVATTKQHPKYKAAKKEKYIINVDIISENFNNGEVVDLNSLKAKGLLPKKCNYFKVLARGILNKSLEVVANDFSSDAIKMILVTGGKVVQIEE